MTIQLDTNSVTRLRDSVAGAVYERGDAGRAAAVACFDPTILQDPDVVVAAATAADVALAVRFAAANGLPVRIQSTGHGAIGTPIADGLLITTQALNRISIDPETRIATVGAGVEWTPVIDAAAEFGLVPVTGSAPSVGAVGYTLGGGLGPLARSHGFTVDWVRAFEVVTGDGEIVIADSATNADLLWALRGGKGGFGVVTEMKIELAPLRTLYAGSLIFEGDSIEPALRAWVDWTQTAPDPVTSSFAFLAVPDVEWAPPPLRGRFVLSVRFAFPGDSAEGERLAAPLREAAPVFLDLLGEIPTTAMGSIHNDPKEGSPTWISGLMLDSIDQSVADDLLRLAGPTADSPFNVVEVRHLGAATHRDTADGTAAGGRGANFAVTLLSADPSTFAERAPERGRAIAAALADRTSSVTNVNWAASLDDPIVFAGAWPPAIFERLAAVRAKYDPDGLFVFGPPNAQLP